MKIGVIGMGVVGQAVAAGHAEHLPVCYDKFKPEYGVWPAKLLKTDLCFVCVPTPTNTTTADQDLSAVENVLAKLADHEYGGVVALKSTVLPMTTELLAKQFPMLRIVHNPEFLSERSARLDYANQKHVLVSGKERDRQVLRDLFSGKEVDVRGSDHYQATEIAKYIHNCLLAVQLSFLNEVYAFNPAVYREASEMASHLGNLNKYHKIPGPDGKLGWGGMCFPKDTKALLTMAVQRGLDMPTLRGAIEFNEAVRAGG